MQGIRTSISVAHQLLFKNFQLPLQCQHKEVIKRVTKGKLPATPVGMTGPARSCYEQRPTHMQTATYWEA